MPAGAHARADVLAGWGRRTAHPFPFADQHTLTAGLGVPVTTCLCFDRPGATRAVFALRRAGAFAGPRRSTTW